MTIGISICTLCDRKDLDEYGNAVCEAFPGGIPAAIAHQGFDHRDEFPEDNGIRFVPRKGVTPERVDEILGLRTTNKVSRPAP